VVTEVVHEAGIEYIGVPFLMISAIVEPDLPEEIFIHPVGVFSEGLELVHVMDIAPSETGLEMGILVLVDIDIGAEITGVIQDAKAAELGDEAVSGDIIMGIPERGRIFPPLARLVALEYLAWFVIIVYVDLVLFDYLGGRAQALGDTGDLALVIGVNIRQAGCGKNKK
jgi:hypothetical protein